MANDIVNFPNSFIQFTTDPVSCNEYNGDKLPINNVYDNFFMLRINSTDVTYLGGISFVYAKGDYAVGDTVEVTDIIKQFWLDSVLISGTDFLLYLSSADCVNCPMAFGSCGETEISPNDCITLAIIDGANLVISAAIPKFYYVDDLCFTETVRYGCADNSYGFLYEEASAAIGAQYYNQIRINIDKTSPSPITKKTGFELSDGSFRTLAASKQKEWQIETDYYTDHIHQCLDAAIDHDFLYIYQEFLADCDYTDFEYFHDQEDKYDIDWQEKPGQHLGVAKAKFKLKTNPYYSQNSNC